MTKGWLKKRMIKNNKKTKVLIEKKAKYKVYVLGGIGDFDWQLKHPVDIIEFDDIPQKIVSWRNINFGLCNTNVKESVLGFITTEPIEELLDGIFYFYYDD